MRNVIVLFVCALALSSCINLKHVQDYTKSSSTSLKKFEELQYTFSQHCSERCVFESVRKSSITRELDCNCAIYNKADSVTFVIYKALNAYFGGLGDLANDKVTNYNFSPLQKALKEEFIPVSGKMIEITADQVSAYSKIASTLLKATTNSYRRKKIRDFIEDGNQPVKTLLGAFQNILDNNLAGVIDFKKERLFAFYNEIILDSCSSIYDRRRGTMEYYNDLDQANKKQKQIEILSKSLKKVADGHDKLVKSKASFKDLAEILSPVITDIQQSISEFNKLQSK